MSIADVSGLAYSPTLLERVSLVSRRDAIRDANVVTNGTERIPLVLTYHPFNSRIKKILLANFNILMNDDTTREIFTLPPLTSYRRDQNIRGILVYTSMKSQSGSPAGTYPCGAPRCPTCAHVSATTIIAGPRHNMTIREHFTCKSSNVIYFAFDVVAARSYTLEKPGVCSGNALVNTFAPLRETHPVSLLRNISTSPEKD